jgi:hypothetical protein
MHFHEFPVIKEAKWKTGSLTKYDIPQYIRNMPEEYPPICTIKEASILRNNKKKEEKEKKKKMQIDLELNNNKKEKENNSLANTYKKSTSTNNLSISKDKKSNNNNNINLLDEPIPNELHKYCHLCKKQFDNYLRHINSKNHKETSLKYSDTFNSIKNVFNRVNTFWNNKSEKNDNNTKNKNTISSNNLNEIEEKIENDMDELSDNNNLKIKLFSQINQSTRDGCKAKKKILINNNSQLSTAQSFPMIPPKKRKKNDLKNIKDKSKSKKNKMNNKSINEFLVRGEFVKSKKNEEEFSFL